MYEHVLEMFTEAAADEIRNNSDVSDLTIVQITRLRSSGFYKRIQQVLRVSGSAWLEASNGEINDPAFAVLCSDAREEIWGILNEGDFRQPVDFLHTAPKNEWRSTPMNDFERDETSDYIDLVRYLRDHE